MKLACVWLSLWFVAASAIQLTPSPALRLERCLAPPGRIWPHFFGFDSFGHDMLLIVLRASFASSAVSLVATSAGCFVALTLGGGIALLPARPRFVALRVLEAWLAFPFLLIALGWAAIRGPGWSTLFAALLIGLVPSFTRLVYARTREILAEPFIEAATSLGASQGRILYRHLLPNLAPIAWAKAPLLFAQCLMAEAALSFLGIGAPIGAETWGSLLTSGKDYLLEAPHVAFTAGVPLVLTLLALQSISIANKNSVRSG